ncbi:uncharacterized protein LOC116109115 [Pistacia vera]|uniref:uncharacterized protein LOC116109115 n=1 Tax=Pistacia vera TaxID=55513 RepID=UPI0012633225|nr:uncharacterized protein LOC116109115 [Pistacia vera]
MGSGNTSLSSSPDKVSNAKKRIRFNPENKSTNNSYFNFLASFSSSSSLNAPPSPPRPSLQVPGFLHLNMMEKMWVSLHIHCFCCVYNGHRKIPSTQPLISRSHPPPA